MVLDTTTTILRTNTTGLVPLRTDPGEQTIIIEDRTQTKTIKVGSSRYDSDKVAPKMSTVSALVFTPGVVDQKDNTTKTSWDTYPSNPFNINVNHLTYDKTEGAKMAK